MNEPARVDAIINTSSIKETVKAPRELRRVVIRYAGASVMAKTKMAREQLTAKALAAIRQEPGCEGVKEISISELEIVDERKCWQVTVVDEGASSFDAAHHAANRVEECLNRRYELVN
jgi:hypothetical protein